MSSWAIQRGEKAEEPISFTSPLPFLPSLNPALFSSRSSEPDSKNALNNSRRLYIGNLHHRVTEFHLLKIVQPFGKLVGFKFLHKTIGDERECRKGFAFVTFSTAEAAGKCLKSLNGKVVCGRILRLRWAPTPEMLRSEREEKLKAKLPVLGIKVKDANEITEEEKEELKLHRAKLINAIEAKLRAIEREKAES